MPVTRKQVIDCARSYLGTPFQHQGRIKGKGIDCSGLALMVGEELGIVGRDGRPLCRDLYIGYSRQPMNSIVYEACNRSLILKPIPAMRPGDVIATRNPALPCHVAIVSEINGVLYMIHAYDGGPRKCFENILDKKWRSRIEGVFSYPGVVE